MRKQINMKALLLALGLMSVSGMAQADFSRTMSNEQVAAEVKVQIINGRSLEMIAREAKKAGLNPVQVTTAMIQAGLVPAGVVTAVVSANPEQASAIVKAAIAAAPDQRRAITTAALTVPGVNPSSILAATAADERAARAPAPVTPPATPPASGGGRHPASPA